MQSLFNLSENQQILNRINHLTADTKPLWGKMNVSQMLAHTQVPILVSFGEHKLKRGLMGILFGKLAKERMINDAPFKKNLPTDKTFLVNNDRNFEEEKNKLLELVQRFARQGATGLIKEPHHFLES
jgi:hypothetical protein